MTDSFQSEVPKARINLKLDLHTGGASKKTELPLKLLVAGDFSNGQESAPLPERKKVNLNKNNFDAVLSEYSPKLNLTVKNTLAGDDSEENISLSFQSMQDFSPEQVSRQIPQLKAMLSMRNLLRDLKANLLDNQAFRKELEKILLDPALSAEQGYGESRPVAANGTPEGRALNRRVEISLVPQANACQIPDHPLASSQDDGASQHNGE